MLVRHLIAIAVLPFSVTVLIPLWVQQYRVPWAPPVTAFDVSSLSAGVACLAIGLLLFAASLRFFAVQGHGTLAPWDPPRRLVVGGPYRYVRNPMISGVLFIVFGEALVLRSRPHFTWALAVLILNLVYIPILEEPMLEQRFGNAYQEYCAHVRRFIPRARPWTPQRGADSAPM